MGPESEHHPSSFHQGLVSLRVSLLVSDDFFGPIIRVNPRLAVMFWAAVPEAAVDKHCYPLSREHQIGSSPEGRNRARGHSISEPHCMDQFPNSQFRTGVP